uniref:BTB domain-containing protein n=1 Tax=Heliothis virescens TaxID=7102 RepID=A0A2A4JH22_HELVI
MAQSQFSLLWNSHKKNICHGLSSLQQNGEFVDMTIAADGHLVKVHQVIIALASPYIKDLISSAQCPHPVIFLNKISYTTLCALLEYVYTGEVLVSIENLNELLEAGKELHIKGLEDMKISETVTTNQQIAYNDNETDCNMESLDEEISYFEVTDAKDNDEDPKYNMTMNNIIVEVEGPKILNTESMNDDTYEDYQDEEENNSQEIRMLPDKTDSKNGDQPNLSVMQFTVSNQGSLQMILNRYVYYLKHTNRNNTRQWRCVDYLNNVKCPAHVFTKDDVVVQRISAHVHPFHDKRILKKVKAGAVFSAIHEAEQQRKLKREETANSD